MAKAAVSTEKPFKQGHSSTFFETFEKAFRSCTYICHSYNLQLLVENPLPAPGLTFWNLRQDIDNIQGRDTDGKLCNFVKREVKLYYKKSCSISYYRE